MMGGTDMCAQGDGYETNVVTHMVRPMELMPWIGKAR